MKVEGSCGIWLCFGFQRCCRNCVLSQTTCQSLQVCCHLQVHLAPGAMAGALQGKGQYSVLKSSPLKPRLGPKLSSVQAGRVPWTFSACQQVCVCVCILGCALHTPPHCVPPARGERHNWCQSICTPEGLSAGHGSCTIQPSFSIQSRTTGETQEFLLLAAEVSSSLSHTSKYKCVWELCPF